MRCQFFDRGCIQVVFRLFFCWKMVFVMVNCFSAQNTNSKRPFSLQFPTPCFPSTPFHASESCPTLALKSPRITTLSSAGVLYYYCYYNCHGHWYCHCNFQRYSIFIVTVNVINIAITAVNIIVLLL